MDEIGQVSWGAGGSRLVCDQRHLVDNSLALYKNITKFGGKVAHGPQKNRLDFGGNLDHVTLGFGWD